METASAMQLKINEAAEFVRQNLGGQFDIAVIFGSGLGKFVEKLEDKTSLTYDKIPHFGDSAVQGHANKLTAGSFAGKRVLAMEGRFHYYEGNEMNKVVLPVRVMQQLGIKRLIVTNAAGGVNRSLHPGQLMLICDHINISGINPLRGGNLDQWGPRFPDLTRAYDEDYRTLAKSIAGQHGIDLAEGVYAFCPGPSYETPAEIRLLALVGADAVGMSTVPEVITAAQATMRVLGISCVTNLAAGIKDTPLNHQEALQAAAAAYDDFSLLLSGFLTALPLD